MVIRDLFETDFNVTGVTVLRFLRQKCLLNGHTSQLETGRIKHNL